MDIVFMRNVLIYFNAETKKAVFAKVKRVLKRDGYLFLGGAETTMEIDDAFKRVTPDKGSVTSWTGHRTYPSSLPKPNADNSPLTCGASSTDGSVAVLPSAKSGPRNAK